MSNVIANFEKVSKEQYFEDFKNLYPNIEYTNEVINDVIGIWEQIKLPKRSDPGSAGYDFYCNFPIINIEAHKPIVIPTGIRCKMDNDYVLLLVPRSGMGFKYGMHLYNTVGVIDSSYYNAKNEGHIMAKFVTEENGLTINAGDRFMQGIFVHYGITTDDDASGERTGGFGSSGN